MDKEIPALMFSPYHKESLGRVMERLDYYQKMTLEEAKVFAEEEFLDSVATYNDRLKSKRLLRKRYEVLLDEVILWNPPTAEHTELKKFCVNQIKDSIELDCDERFISVPSGKHQRSISLMELSLLKMILNTTQESIKKKLNESISVINGYKN
ncbi:hypothetical protein H6F38_14670 [Paenibacillus sp. EKM208P]|nr:hypothetical protein H6F38_14670 [Paenibacillus sp. EKM208P]